MFNLIPHSEREARAETMLRIAAERAKLAALRAEANNTGLQPVSQPLDIPMEPRFRFRTRWPQ